MIIIYILAGLLLLFAVAELLDTIEKRIQPKLDKMNTFNRELTKFAILALGAFALCPYLALVIGQYS